jgi:hypothetical protein
LALERFQTPLRDLRVPSEELRQVFFQNLENLQEVLVKPKKEGKFLSVLCYLATTYAKVKAISPIWIRLTVNF